MVRLAEPLIRNAMNRCRQQIEVRANLPLAWSCLGVFHLLIGEPYKALSAFNQVARLCSPAAEPAVTADESTRRPCAAGRALLRTRDTFRRIKCIRGQLDGFDWCERAILLELAIRVKDSDAAEALRSLASPASPGKPYPTPERRNLILAGACSEALRSFTDRFETQMLKACEHLGVPFTILSGGTAAGVSATAGAITAQSRGSIWSLGYLNRRGSGGALDSDVVRLTYEKDDEPLGGYDPWGRVTSLRHLDVDPGTDIAAFEYGYSAASDRLYEKDSVNPGQDQLYGYDTLSRLTFFERGTLNAARDTILGRENAQSWSLDALGNWLQFDDDDTNDFRQHNEANEITARTLGGNARVIEHDAAGNLHLLQDETGTTGKKFIYDYRNRLIEVYTTTDITAGEPVWQRIVSYYYDALNRRVEKDLDTGTDLLYIYDGWRCIEEREWDGAWNAVRQYVHGGRYIDEPIMVRVNPGDQWNSYYYCQQANYNVVALTDSTGEAIGTVAYDPYGRFRVISGALAGDHYLFQGRRWDSDTDLYYFRNRDYSPELGRFLQRDPAGYVDGMGLYEFLGADPLTLVDPLGLEWKVTRGGEDWAQACGEEGDPVSELARMIRLAPTETLFWLKPGKQPDYVVAGDAENFLVPNKVVIVVGEASIFWRWCLWSDAKALKAAFEGKGFKVVVIDATKVERASESVQEQSDGIWGFAYFGHGYKPKDAETMKGACAPTTTSWIPGLKIKWKAAPTDLIAPQDFAKPYRLGFFMLLSCFSSQGHWAEHGSPFCKAYTVEGFDVAPLGAWNFAEENGGSMESIVGDVTQPYEEPKQPESAAEDVGQPASSDLIRYLGTWGY